MFIYYSANINEFFTQQIAFCQNMKSLFGDIDQMSSYYFGGEEHMNLCRWIEFSKTHRDKSEDKEQGLVTLTS